MLCLFVYMLDSEVIRVCGSEYTVVPIRAHPSPPWSHSAPVGFEPFALLLVESMACHICDHISPLRWPPRTRWIWSSGHGFPPMPLGLAVITGIVKKYCLLNSCLSKQHFPLVPAKRLAAFHLLCSCGQHLFVGFFTTTAPLQDASPVLLLMLLLAM